MKAIMVDDVSTDDEMKDIRYEDIKSSYSVHSKEEEDVGSSTDPRAINKSIKVAQRESKAAI